MPTITTKDGVEIYYKDWGSGQPIVFSHGWPLSADDWDNQMLFFLSKGYRVVAHDRRGHGRSTQVADGHDMDHYADDLAALTAPRRWRRKLFGSSRRFSADSSDASPRALILELGSVGSSARSFSSMEGVRPPPCELKGNTPTSNSYRITPSE
jgi:pimeloyl-ACP methyl ester carboxylesterase